MSAVCVLTPIVIGSWPVVSAAVAGALASMGFSVATAGGEPAIRTHHRVEEAIENSEVLEEHLGRGETVTAEKDDLQVQVGRDERGTCTVCVSGEGYTDSQLRRIAREISAKVVQQYTYHKVVSELKTRRFTIANEQVAADGTIKLHIRRAGR
jgi:hypothetical protein